MLGVSILDEGLLSPQMLQILIGNVPCLLQKRHFKLSSAYFHELLAFLHATVACHNHHNFIMIHIGIFTILG